MKTFVLPTGSFSGSIAIRYNVVNGGPAGDNSDYIGIDAIELDGDGLLPVELSSFVSVISNNNVTLNWSTASETNNSGFDIERNSNGQWSKIGNVTGNGTTPISNNYSFTDRNLTSGIYNYRLKQIDFNGNFEYFNLNSEVNIGVPAKFELSQNYPNPFNPSTQINYNLPVDGKVSLRLFDMSGKEISTIVNEVKTAGYYSVSFNAGNLPSGVYFYSIEANDFSAVKKMMLVK
ncbi:MAG: T9SS type A sorting domain-containing protein [Ignavibacteria bacterium]|nr:T9SS type A sorting domain-containing protein [Ignavibacteria bacterium]